MTIIKALSVERARQTSIEGTLHFIRTLPAKGADSDTAGLPADEEADHPRGREPSRNTPMAVSHPLLNDGSGGCSGLGFAAPDSLLI